MPTTLVSSVDKERLGRFLRRRQLNERMVTLLDDTRQRLSLQRGEISTAKNSTYSTISESLAKALKEGWIGTDDLTRIFDEAELAGRQHLCLFDVPDDELDKVELSLRSPATLNKQAVQLNEFWDDPLGAYSRLLVQDGAVTIVKIVAPRFYWTEDERQPSDDEIQITKLRHRERSAVIVKLDRTTKRLQFRVPIREKAPNADTGHSVYDFVRELVESQFDAEGLRWFNLVRPFPLNDAFQKIIENRSDFELYSDTPENSHFKTSMSHRGTSADASDIRDFKQWGYKSGFARSSVRGAWIDGDDTIHVRLNYEQIRLTKKVSRFLCRLFFSNPCTDAQVEHVIKRVSEHL